MSKDKNNQKNQPSRKADIAKAGKRAGATTATPKTIKPGKVQWLVRMGVTNRAIQQVKANKMEIDAALAIIAARRQTTVIELANLTQYAHEVLAHKLNG